MNNLSSSGQITTAHLSSGIFFFLLIFLAIYYVYIALCLFRIAKKTRTNRAWFAWVPILDILLSLRIARRPIWWIALYFIPLFNLVFYILVWMSISRRLGKPEWLGLFMIITPINLFIPGYLAFSQSRSRSKKDEVRIMHVSF